MPFEKDRQSGVYLVPSQSKWGVLLKFRRVTRRTVIERAEKAARAKQQQGGGKKRNKGSRSEFVAPGGEDKEKQKKNNEQDADKKGEGNSNNNNNDDDDVDVADDPELLAGLKLQKDEEEEEEDKGPLEVYCPRFPHEKKAVWWCFITDATKKKVVSSLARLQTPGTDYAVQFMQLPPVQVGLQAFHVHLFCDSYLGADSVVSFQVKGKKQKERAVAVQKGERGAGAGAAGGKDARAEKEAEIAAEDYVEHDDEDDEDDDEDF